jgi:DNA repair exonuclease SbcCD ATPase subunit
VESVEKGREAIMDFTYGELKEKITEMYPEIGEHHLSVTVDFSAAKNAYIVTFQRGQEQLSTHLEKKDADECMSGIKCVYLGVQVAQFIKNFEERKVFSRKVA